VGFFTKNPTNLVLQFSEFFTIFYAIYKNQQKHFYYFRFTFVAGTLEVLDSLKKSPYFAAEPLERILTSQCGPLGWPAAVWPKSGESRRRDRSGTAWGWPRGC
jgi:hypothetical protein